MVGFMDGFSYLSQPCKIHKLALPGISFEDSGIPR